MPPSDDNRPPSNLVTTVLPELRGFGGDGAWCGRNRKGSSNVARQNPSAVLRTQTIDETQGFMKALVAARDDHILGFTMIGAEAGEVMAVVQMAILAGLPYTNLC